MKSKIFLRLIIFCFFCFAGIASSAEKITVTEAESWTNQKGQALLKAFAVKDIKTKYAQLDEMFLNDVDLDYIGKFVMGKYWRQMTPEQQKKYIPLFKRYSLSLYKSFPLDFNINIKFKVTNVKIDKNYADVTTFITVEEKEINRQPENSAEQNQEGIVVGFRIHKDKGRLKIIDLKLAESSLILSYRGRFYEMIRELDDEMEWFLEDLETITASAEQQNQMKLEQQNF